MLILTRKPGESLYIGDNVKITIVEIKGHQIRVGIDAPPELRIYREEIYLQILEENKKAADASAVSEAGLDQLASGWFGRAEGKPAKSSLKATLSSKQPETSKLSAAPRTDMSKAAGPEVIMRRKGKRDDKDGDENE